MCRTIVVRGWGQYCAIGGLTRRARRGFGLINQTEWHRGYQTKWINPADITPQRLINSSYGALRSPENFARDCSINATPPLPIFYEKRSNFQGCLTKYIKSSQKFVLICPCLLLFFTYSYQLSKFKINFLLSHPQIGVNLAPFLRPLVKKSKNVL